MEQEQYDRSTTVTQESGAGKGVISDSFVASRKRGSIRPRANTGGWRAARAPKH